LSVTSHACGCAIEEEEEEEEEEPAVQSAPRKVTFLLALSAVLAGEGGGPEAS